jgi:Amt family ammonium transporter
VGIFALWHCGYDAYTWATEIKFIIGIDDALDILALHAIGGAVRNILTGFFAKNAILLYTN